MFKVSNKETRTTTIETLEQGLKYVQSQQQRNQNDNNGNTRTRCEICSKLTIKMPRQCRRRSGVFIVNFERILYLVLVFLLLTLNR